MAQVTQYSSGFYNSSNSNTTFVSALSVPAKELATVCLMKAGLLIPIINQEKFVSVQKPFYIQLSPVENGYVATSVLSDVYEQEVSVGSVVRSYLHSLVDELLWLQERKENLSKPLHKQLEMIQSYLQIS